MAPSKRRSPTSTLVSKDALSQASGALQELPEKPKEIWSLREAINLLKDQITIALDRGYSYSEVSQMLSKTGVEISPSTLKYYLSSARKEDGTGKTRTRRRRRTLSLPAEELKTSLANGTAEAAPAPKKEAAPAVKTPARRGKAAPAAKAPAAKAPAAKAPKAAKPVVAKAKPAAKAPKAAAAKPAAKPATRTRKKAAG
jgi:hypothetical protein